MMELFVDRRKKKMASSFLIYWRAHLQSLRAKPTLMFTSGSLFFFLCLASLNFFLMRCYCYCLFSNLCLASLKIKVLLFVFDDMLLLLFIFMFGELEDKSPLLCFRGYFTLIVYSYTCSTSLKTLSLTLNCFITFVPCLDIVITIQKQQYNKMKWIRE